MIPSPSCTFHQVADSSMDQTDVAMLGRKELEQFSISHYAGEVLNRLAQLPIGCTHFACIFSWPSMTRHPKLSLHLAISLNSRPVSFTVSRSNVGAGGTVYLLPMLCEQLQVLVPALVLLSVQASLCAGMAAEGIVDDSPSSPTSIINLASGCAHGCATLHFL